MSVAKQENALHQVCDPRPDLFTETATECLVCPFAWPSLPSLWKQHLQPQLGHEAKEIQCHVRRERRHTGSDANHAPTEATIRSVGHCCHTVEPGCEKCIASHRCVRRSGQRNSLHQFWVCILCLVTCRQWQSIVVARSALCDASKLQTHHSRSTRS